MVQLRLPDDGVPVYHGLQVALEQALHILGIGAGAPQVGRRLEGAAAGTVGKVLGIQHNARQQCLRFAFQHIGGLHQILH